jgi:uncharacterized membrane protein
MFAAYEETKEGTLMTRFEEKVSAYLAGFVVAMVPYAFTMLLFKDVPSATRDIVMVLVGVIAANATQAVQHRFGSNPASNRKDTIIETLTNTASKAQDALVPLAGTAAVETIPVAEGERVVVEGKSNETSIQS